MRALRLVLAYAALVALGQSDARAQVLDPIQYALVRGSYLEYGCMGPCECPVVFINGLQGGFTFYRTSVDPLYSHYELLNIAWTYTVGDSASGTLRTVHMRGHGTYDIGGEVATLQRMTLDVISDDTLDQHFDSGFVPTRAPFPAIDIDVHTAPTTCLDSLIRVAAAPQGFTGVPPVAARMVDRVAPNPARAGIEVRFVPTSSGHARVDVIDIGGRVVTTLVDGPVTAGEYLLRWDGRDSRGTEVGSGIFWVRARLGDRVERARFARIR